MPGLQDAAIQAAETIQTAHIVGRPSTEHDVAPATAAEGKEPVQFDHSDDLDGDASDVEEDEVPVSMLRPTPRRPQMPPLPDLRFEQSYLASIKDAKGWQGVAFITLRDQVCLSWSCQAMISVTPRMLMVIRRCSCRLCKAWSGRSS